MRELFDKKNNTEHFPSDSKESKRESKNILVAVNISQGVPKTEGRVGFESINFPCKHVPSV